MAGRGPRAGGDRRMPGMPDGTRVTGEAWARDPWDAGWGAQGLRDSSGQWDPSQFHDDDQGCHAGRPRTGEWPDGEASVRQGATRERRGGERPDGDGIGARHRDAALVRIHDPAGRPRGLGFVADHHGTVVTSHEVVDGMPRLVLHTAEGDRRCVVPASAVTPLPALDLALVRTEGLGVDPLPVTVRDRIETGAYVRIAAGGWREARVLGATSVTYTATDRCHLLDDALELAIGTAG
ncbi:trypsin-like peptidase domain-containing protein, partial [Streptomyces sp. T21Q-yed]|nr:hypothetical protein [Streptomyces sp. T21Q-yed]